MPRAAGWGLSPLRANIALHVLDEHMHRPWKSAGTRSTPRRRARRRANGLPNWRIVRYADDLLALCHSKEQAEQVKARLAASAD